MQSDENVAVVERFIDALNRQDLAELEGIVAPDVRRHSRATPGVEVRSWQDFRDFLERDFGTFADVTQTILLTVADGEHVAALVRLSGTHRGAFGPIPATGRAIETEFLSILRIADGRIAEMWVEWDNLAILAQLGVEPFGGA